MAKKTKAVKKTDDVKDFKEFNLVDNVIIDDSGAADDVAPEPVKTKKLSPFEIIRMMFEDSAAFDNLTDYVLEQNFFMINRTFSIKYPLQAQYFNKLNINGAQVVKFWRTFLVAKEGYGRTPQFIFTGGAKKQGTTKEKTKAEQLDKESIIGYCKKMHYSLKDFNDMLYFFNEETVAAVEHFEKMNSKSEQMKAFKSTKSKKADSSE